MIWSCEHGSRFNQVLWYRLISLVDVSLYLYSWISSSIGRHLDGGLEIPRRRIVWRTKDCWSGHFYKDGAVVKVQLLFHRCCWLGWVQQSHLIGIEVWPVSGFTDCCGPNYSWFIFVQNEHVFECYCWWTLTYVYSSFNTITTQLKIGQFSGVVFQRSSSKIRAVKRVIY